MLGRSTSWSTTPASSTWRRSRSFPREQWDAVIAINLTAAFHAIQAALPDMKARSWGRIVNIASAHGLVASVNKSAYVAAKHGLVGLTKVGRSRLARRGITCNAICPGWVLTPLVQKQIDALAAKEKLSEKTMRRSSSCRSSPRSSSPPRSSSARSPRSTPRRSSTAWRYRWMVGWG